MSTPIPKCPNCQQPLQWVKNSGWMNEDQFDAVKPGDWFCECSSNGRGCAPYAYFWDREVAVPAPPPPPTPVSNLTKAQKWLKWLWQSDKLTPEQDKELEALINDIDNELMKG